MTKTIVITGSTDGIGKLAALELASAGHEVIVHGRNRTKLQSTISEIKLKTGNEKIKGCIADLSDFQSIKQFSDELSDSLSKIDVLINNAGVFKSPIATNKDGFDIRLMVNYLAPYVLTKSVMNLLQEGNQPRLINLSSAAQSSVNLNALKGNASLSTQEAYAQSKLALTMWSFDLAQLQRDVQVIAVNPGSLLNTKMVQEAYGQHWSSADKGSSILVRLATSEEFKGVTGKYFDNDRGSFGDAHSDAYDQKKIKELIEVTEILLQELA